MNLPTAATEPTDDWDTHAVDAIGGHVYQSVAWAEQRRATGWRPVFLAGDGYRILALTRPWPLVGGSSAYIPRGPVPTASGEEVGRRLMAATRVLGGLGVDVLAADAEVPVADRAYRDALRGGGFAPIEEIQPSRHRMTLALAGRDEADVRAGIAKSTRQRIRKAEASDLAIVRHDVRIGPDGVGEGFAAPAEPAAAALDRFYDLLLATGERRDFTFGPRAEFVGWWQRAHAAGHLVLLEARDGDEPLAGLVLYRHGGRFSTVHSADRAETRRAHPGALHLLRWRAVQLAIREGREDMDLGGADVRGARRIPLEGEPTHGLYEHKRAFGAEWLELTGAHERILRPRRARVGGLYAAIARRIPAPLRTLGRGPA